MALSDLVSKSPSVMQRSLSCFFRGRHSQDSSWSWVVCISAAVCNAINIGFGLSFGVLFPELMSSFDETIERTAFVGSATLGMTWFASPLAGYFCDRFGCRITAFLGGLLCIAGLFFTSFVQSLSCMYFTHSLVYGLGGCLLYNSSYLIVAKYFKKQLSMATGIVCLGASLGIIYTGPLVQFLIDSFGWRGTFRIMSITFTLACLLSLSFNPNVQETSSEENVVNNNSDENNKNNQNKVEEKEESEIALYCSVWKFPTYTFVVMSLIFGSFGLFIPIIYLVKYSEEVGISAQKASRLFIFVGLASSIARLVSGRLCNADRVNAVYIYQASLLLASVSTFLLPFATTYWELILYSAAYGLSDGVFITTNGFIVLSCVDAKRRTAAFSINNVLYAVTAAAGGPIVGVIVDKTGNYVYSFYMTGGVLLTAFLIPMVLIVLSRRRSKVGPLDCEQTDEGVDRDGRRAVGTHYNAHENN